MAYQPNYYFIEEYQIPSMPSIMIYDTHLDIEVDYDGEWYINGVAMRDNKDKVVTFKKGDWLFDLLVKNIYDDHRMMDIISEECKV
jgi:hypothetical protein